MSRDMSLTFLGTSSGGGPSDSRSCSSLVLDILGNGDLWLVDCAEGTTRQFALQPERNGQKRLKTSKVTKIFITHLHFDHCMGIITLLATTLRQAAGAPQPPRSKPPLVELYGPAGLRTFVRSILNMTRTELTERYVVHELLTPTDTPTSCDLLDMHHGESTGRNILSNSTGQWVDFAVARNIGIDAAPLNHRAPCLGYVFRETSHLNRKIVVLGDTSDPSAVTSLAQNATLLVHEATDAHIPVEIDRTLRGDKKTPQIILEKTIAKGHSTPGMAGTFARSINAQKLILNHFSGKFPAPSPNRHDRRRAVMSEIERQASETWGMGHAIAAYDYLRVDIPGENILSESLSRFREPYMGPSDLPGPPLSQHIPSSRHTLPYSSSSSRKVLKRRKT
ncbi:beta-lactamase-like protein [Phellopilus nigrolimitatus]|nr:beta-lactamase-like protein [Phellopilus nigrolimitatus]